MSYILDALRRAERERQSGQPGLPPAPGLPPPPVRRGIPRWLVAGGIAAVIAAALVAWVVLRRPQAEPAAHAPQGAATAQRAQARRPGPAAAAPATPRPSPPVLQPMPVPAPAVIPGTEDVSSLDDLTEAPPDAGDTGADREPPPPAPTASVALPPAAAVPPDTSAAPAAPGGGTATDSAPAPGSSPPAPSGNAAAPAAARPAAPRAAPSRGATAKPSPPPALPPVLTQPVPMRTLKEMPPEYRADFPALSVEVHNYERDPSRRFVVINGHKYHQGERLGEGPQLVEIVKDGLVMEFRGEKVLYPL